jgi:DNA-binding response OmpR family regulator
MTTERHGSAGLRILVVEDDVTLAELTAALLGMSGHEVRTALDGPAALEASRAEPPDVVLLDIGLPGMDGYQVARRLRREPTDRRPVIVAVSGFGQREDRLHSYESGIDLHLTKPVDAEELLALLERLQVLSGPA